MKNRYALWLLVIFSFLHIQAIDNDSISTNETKKTPVSDKTIVFVFDIKEQIAPPAWRNTQKGFEEAEKAGADYIIIHMNTYGGMVTMADSIRTKILNSKIPVYVFIDNNAASAGALISIACDSIYMRKGANIGAATVVNQSGEVVPDKYQSYMRSTMRATAEAHGKDTIITGNDTIIRWFRNPLIAEAMVDPSIAVRGVIDSGKVLTFTTSEAIENGFCEGQAENITEVLKVAGIENYEIKQYKLTQLEKVITFFMRPVVQGILIMLILGGIYIEIQTPGIGVPLGLAAFAALLYFAPLYLEGLAENWEVLLFIAGLLLMALEVFVVPGFGVAGISGIVLMVTGLTLSMIDNIVFELDGKVAFAAVAQKLMIVAVSLSLSLVLVLFTSKRLLSSGIFSKLALQTTERNEDGYISIDINQKKLIGKKGIAATVLRPSGRIEIDGELYDAKSEIGFIDKGQKIKVIRDETGQLYVMKDMG